MSTLLCQPRVVIAYYSLSKTIILQHIGYLDINKAQNVVVKLQMHTNALRVINIYPQWMIV